jgi:hypothetical protein
LLALSNTLHQALGGGAAERARVEKALRLPRSLPYRGRSVVGEATSS